MPKDVALGLRGFKPGLTVTVTQKGYHNDRCGQEGWAFINTQWPEETNVAAEVPLLVEQVRVARDAGFRSLWFPHHWLTYPMQMLQIMPAMAYLAAEAKGMVIGPNILILPLLNPMHVAEEAATLDVITGGNYVLGAGPWLPGAGVHRVRDSPCRTGGRFQRKRER